MSDAFDSLSSTLRLEKAKRRKLRLLKHKKVKNNAVFVRRPTVKSPLICSKCNKKFPQRFARDFHEAMICGRQSDKFELKYCGNCTSQWVPPRTVKLPTGKIFLLLQLCSQCVDKNDELQVNAYHG